MLYILVVDVFIVAAKNVPCVRIMCGVLVLVGSRCRITSCELELLYSTRGLPAVGRFYADSSTDGRDDCTDGRGDCTDGRLR